MEQTEVLIVGAGPTGLMIACELARYGIDFRIIDQAEAPTKLSKALALQARTLEIFDQIGILDPFIKEGLPLKGVNLHSKQIKLAHVSFKHIKSPFPFVLSLEQSKTEHLLSEHLANQGHSAQRNHQLLEFSMQTEAITAVIEDKTKGSKYEIKAKYLIGCDGAHSTIRKGLNLSFKGKLFSQIFSLADVHIDWDRPHDELSVFFDKSGILAALPIPEKNRYRLMFQLKRCQKEFKKLPSTEHGVISSETIAPPSLEETEKLLTYHAGNNVHARDPIWMANFHINSRLSSHYHKDRVFLAGDAAHIHSPIGGQGMNTGIQDAFNLAWKLSYVLRYQAPIELLDSFEAERHAIGKKLLKATEETSSAAVTKNPFLMWTRKKALSVLGKKETVQSAIANAISQTTIRYPKSDIFASKGHMKNSFLVGSRVPNISLYFENGQTDLYNLRKDATFYTLLLFIQTPLSEETKITLRKLEKEVQEDVCQLILISKEPLDLNLESSSVFMATDPNQKYRTTFSIPSEGIYIIRPDGYICYRAPYISLEKIVSHLKKQINL